MFAITCLKLLQHSTGKGIEGIYEDVSKLVSTAKGSSTPRRKQKQSVVLSTSLASSSSSRLSLPNANPPRVSSNVAASPEESSVKLLVERVKWFGHIIPAVSLVVLETLRSDSVPGHSIPEHGNLLVLDSWDEFTHRRSTPCKEERLFATQQTVQMVVKAMRTFLAQHEEPMGFSTLEEIARLPLIVLIPSQLDPVVATREQLVLEQAILMNAECIELGLHRLTTLWVMNSEESWRWSEVLREGTVSATWPLRAPQYPNAAPRRLLQPPPIPDEKFNHIIPTVDLREIHAVFSSSPSVVLPSVGHLLLLRDTPSSASSSSTLSDFSPPSTEDGSAVTPSPPVEKVTSLMPVIERAIKDYVAAIDNPNHRAKERHQKDGEKHQEVPPLTVLVLSFLSSTEAADLQHLLHYSLLMTFRMQSRHFSGDPVVWVLSGEQKEKLTRAYHSNRVGLQWTSATSSHLKTLGSSHPGLARTTVSEVGVSPPSQPTLTKKGERRHSNKSTSETLEPEPHRSTASPAVSTSLPSSDSGSVMPFSQMSDGEKEAERKTPLSWTPPQDLLVGENGDPIPILSSELESHGEIETLWSSAPGFPVDVASLQLLLSPTVFAKIQDVLQCTFWQPPRLHVLACHAGAEQLEQNTAMMFKDLMRTAADYFEIITGESALRDSLNGNPPRYEIQAGEVTGLEDPEVVLEDTNGENRQKKAVVNSPTSILRDGSTTSKVTSQQKDQKKAAGEKKLCNARYVKIIILLYTDLIVQSEVNILRLLIRNLYYQLPESAQNIIVKLEVMDVNAPPAREALEGLKVSESIVDSPEEEESEKRKDSNSTAEATNSGNLSIPQSNEVLDDQEKSNSFRPEALTDALHASSQFLKLLQQREHAIRAEIQKVNQQRNQMSEEQQRQRFLASPSSSVEETKFMHTTKAELKNLLEDAVEEVTARHEQAMSQLVDTMSKMVGAWASDSFLQELSTTIKKGIEPLQEHLSESAAASAKYRRGMAMSEEVGKELLHKLDTLLAIFSPSSLPGKSSVEPKLDAAKDDVEDPALFDSLTPTEKSISLQEDGNEIEEVSTGVSGSGIDAQHLDPEISTGDEHETQPRALPQCSLKISFSEVRFLNRVAKKLQRQRKRKGSKAAAKAWLSAKKHVFSDQSKQYYRIVLPRSVLMKSEEDPDSVLHGIVVQLIESAYLLGRPRLRRGRAKSRSSRRRSTTTLHRKRRVHTLARRTLPLPSPRGGANEIISSMERIPALLDQQRKVPSPAVAPLSLGVKKMKTKKFRSRPRSIRSLKKRKTLLARVTGENVLKTKKKKLVRQKKK